MDVAGIRAVSNLKNRPKFECPDCQRIVEGIFKVQDLYD